MTRGLLARVSRALSHAWALGAVSLAFAAGVSAAAAGDLTFQLVPATYSPAIAETRMQASLVEPELTSDLLAAYVLRQQQLANFDGFDTSPAGELTEELLSSYIARKRNQALEAIESVEADAQPALTASVLAEYAADKFVPTPRKVEVANEEKLCLTQAIYHEARGESESGQWAVANVIVNRAMSRKYPSTICGVVFQNADKGRYRCQFTFACDGRSDMGNERRAWAKAVRLAEAAYRGFVQGDRPDVLPSTALYYHTTAVRPRWSNSFRRVAAIGSHIFYAVN